MGPVPSRGGADHVSDIHVIALLLHGAAGGWDEVILVGVGLGIAYLVIVWTGRRSPEPDDEDPTSDAEDQRS